MPPCGAAFFVFLSALAPAGYARPGWGRCISLFTFGVPSQPTPRACPVGFGVPQMKPKRRRWRHFHHFPRRDPHPVNPAACGPALPRPVGVGVLDDPNVGLPRGKIQRRYVKTRRRTRDAEEAGVARFIFSRLPLCCREPNIRARSALPAGSGADRGRARFAISSRSWPASFRFLSSSNASWQCPQSR